MNDKETQNVPETESDQKLNPIKPRKIPSVLELNKELAELKVQFDNFIAADTEFRKSIAAQVEECRKILASYKAESKVDLSGPNEPSVLSLMHGAPKED